MREDLGGAILVEVPAGATVHIASHVVLIKGTLVASTACGSEQQHCTGPSAPGASPRAANRLLRAVRGMCRLAALCGTLQHLAEEHVFRCIGHTICLHRTLGKHPASWEAAACAAYCTGRVWLTRDLAALTTTQCLCLCRHPGWGHRCHTDDDGPF